MTGPGTERAARVGERIRQELMGLLLRGVVKDPGVQGAVVHGVDVSADLAFARVYVRLTDPDASRGRREALLRGLGRARGFLRAQLGRRLQTRVTPELRFVWDDTTERATRIETILSELRAERAEEE